MAYSYIFILKISILRKNLKLVGWIDSLRHFSEKHGFAVSSRFADKLGIDVSNVRLFFIYISFVTLGFSFGIYLTLAFLLRLKDMVYTKRKSVFDL